MGNVCIPALSSMEERELAELVRHRRALHRIPELGFELPRTIAYVEGALAQLACEISHPCEGCVCAFFDAGAPRTCAIRADMDALPVSEATGAAFSSEHEGCMHACGHDAHMAMALTAARFVDGELRARPGSLPRNVLFVFQPAEETVGGARQVCESGVFERYRTERIFGFHVWPDLPAGVLASAPGPLLAQANATFIDIFGRSMHIAQTYGFADAELEDTVLAGSRYLTEANALICELAADEPCLAHYGYFHAGSAGNVIAGRARIEGSLRTFSTAMYERATRGLIDVLARACAEYGCSYTIKFNASYPPVVNDAALFEAAAGALPELARVSEPLLIAEDFSFYQQRLPGVFFLLGVGSDEYAAAHGGMGAAAPLPEDGLGYASSALHTSALMFDERILLEGVSVYKRLVRLP